MGPARSIKVKRSKLKRGKNKAAFFYKKVAMEKIKEETKMSEEDPWEWAKATAKEIGMHWEIAEEVMFSMSPEVFGTALDWVKRNRNQIFQEMDLKFAFFCFMSSTRKTLNDFRKFGFSYTSSLSRSKQTVWNFCNDVSSILSNIRVAP